MHDVEESTIGPYYLAPNIQRAVNEAESSGALVAVPHMKISGHGRCAIVMFDQVQSGFSAFRVDAY